MPWFDSHLTRYMCLVFSVLGVSEASLESFFQVSKGVSLSRLGAHNTDKDKARYITLKNC